MKKLTKEELNKLIDETRKNLDKHRDRKIEAIQEMHDWMEEHACKDGSVNTYYVNGHKCKMNFISWNQATLRLNPCDSSANIGTKYAGGMLDMKFPIKD